MSWYISVFRNYDDFSGRARRKEYWLFLLINMVIMCVAAILDYVVGTHEVTRFGVLGLLWLAAIAVPSWAVGVRRLHDSGRSGWWLLVSLVPFIGPLAIIVLILLPGTPGENEYGRNPRPQLAVA